MLGEKTKNPVLDVFDFAKTVLDKDKHPDFEHFITKTSISNNATTLYIEDKGVRRKGIGNRHTGNCMELIAYQVNNPVVIYMHRAIPKKLIPKAERVLRDIGTVFDMAYIGSYSFNYSSAGRYGSRSIALTKDSTNKNSKTGYGIAIELNPDRGKENILIAQWLRSSVFTEAGLDLYLKFRREGKDVLFSMTASYLKEDRRFGGSHFYPSCSYLEGHTIYIPRKDQDMLKSRSSTGHGKAYFNVHCSKSYPNSTPTLNSFIEQYNIQYGRKKKHKLKIYSRHPSHKKVNGLPNPITEVKSYQPLLLPLGFKKKDIIIDPATKSIKSIDLHLSKSQKNARSIRNMRQVLAKCVDKHSMLSNFHILGVTCPVFLPLSSTNTKGNRIATWENVQNWIKNHNLEKSKFVVKRRYRSKGLGMELLQNVDELKEFVLTKSQYTNVKGKHNYYIIEKYYNYAQEYRVLYVQGHGVVQAYRKLRKNDADKRWFFNSENSVFVEKFDKPKCWSKIVSQLQRYVDRGLLLASFDIRVSKDGERFVIIEANSAPSLGENTSKNFAKVLQEFVDKNNY